MTKKDKCEALLKMKLRDECILDTCLVSDVVGEPVESLIEPLTRGGTSALDVPGSKETSINHRQN